MSEKNLDIQGRIRSKAIAFRMPPEEAELLQMYADVSGMTKQDYPISRVLQRDVIVVPNKRMQLYMEESMAYVCKELRRIDVDGGLPADLADATRMLCGIFIGLGKDEEELVAVSEEDLIMGLER